MWLSNAIHRQQGYAVSGLSENEPIRILHLSDLQFGSSAPADFLAESALAASVIRRHWAGPPTFIAITGDVAERGLPSEYEIAKTWLIRLAAELDEHWSNERFLLIPGNHDLCWPLAWSARIDIKAKQLTLPGDNPELEYFIIEPFRQFAAQLGGEACWLNGTQYWTSGRYRRLGIILFGCNTCEQVGQWGEPTKVLVDGTLSKMFREVRGYRADAPEAVVIGLMHHPLFADEPKDVLSNRGSLLKNLSDQASDTIILSGHVHSDGYNLNEADGIRVLELAASTMTKKEEHRPPDSLRSFSLITLERRANRVTRLVVDLCRFERHRLEVRTGLQFERTADGQFNRIRGDGHS
jgi:hypothetical protein